MFHTGYLTFNVQRDIPVFSLVSEEGYPIAQPGHDKYPYSELKLFERLLPFQILGGEILVVHIGIEFYIFIYKRGTTAVQFIDCL